MTPREEALLALVRVRARIEDPERWTKNARARTERDKHCAPWSPNATKWCVTGALELEASMGTVAWQIAQDYMGEESRPYGEYSVQGVNDVHGHSVVLEVVDRTIERLRGLIA